MLDKSSQSSTISRLSHDGRGVTSSSDGRITFVTGALPGEDITWQPVRKNKKYLDAKVVEVIKNSEDRITPKCSKFLICGGCSLQHLSTEKQLEFKGKIVAELLEHFGGVKASLDASAITAKNYGYRHRARLSVRYVEKKNKVLIGFTEKLSRYIAEIDHCEVLHPKIADLLKPLEELIYNLSVRSEIPQIEVALGDSDLSLTIRHLKELNDNDKTLLREFAEKNSIILFFQPKGLNSIYNFYPGEVEFLEYSIWIPAYAGMTEKDAGMTKDDTGHEIKYHFKTTDFTQINPSMNQKMVNYALELLDLNNQDIVLDLFCGLGNFTLPIAKQAKKAVGVELSSDMVQRGYHNAKLNNINNANFYQQDLIEIGKLSSSSIWLKECYNKVLLDPARSGAKEILPTIIEIAPERIVYVSCNPATFARDAGILCESGYKLNKINLLDMFPHTAHVETIALFTK